MRHGSPIGDDDPGMYYYSLPSDLAPLMSTSAAPKIGQFRESLQDDDFSDDPEYPNVTKLEQE